MHARSINGVMAITRDEGAFLGTISTVLIDPESRRLARVGVRRHRWSPEQVADAAQIVSIGKDVVLLTSEASLQVATQMDGNMRSLQELKGLWVTTTDGDHVGMLEDIEIEPGDWRVSELHLRGGQMLEIRGAEDCVLGHDEILVSPAAKATMSHVAEPRRGLRERLFGRTAAEEPTGSVDRDMAEIEPEETEHSEAPRHH